MTREEAWVNLHICIDTYLQMPVTDDEINEMHHLTDLLKPPVPDPETGLVPCGCGKPLKLFSHSGEYNERHHARNPETNILDKPSTWETPPSWWVECTGCPLLIGAYYSDLYDCIVGNFESPEEAIKAANRAMGYKEEKA
jgi:hypothetical protein